MIAKASKKPAATKAAATKAARKQVGRDLGIYDNPSVVPKVALAQCWEAKIDPAGYLMSEKLDGMRAYWDGAGLWTRSGKPIAAPAWFTAPLPIDVELDGELFLGRGAFQELMTITRRHDATEAWRRVRYVVFDAPAAPGGLEARLRAATAAAGRVSHVTVHPQQLCRGREHLQQELRRVEALKGEGLMLRTAAAGHRGGRTWDLLKVKSAHDDEALVTGYEAGQGKHAGRTGALVCRARSGKTFKVGTGLSDAQRAKPPKVGAVITYKYSELTKDGIPRFPVFMRPRPDVQAADFK